jgi:hypothetical protein
MNEQQCRAREELRQVIAFYEIDWLDWYNGKDADGLSRAMLFGHAGLARVASSLGLADGQAELETARLLRALRQVLVGLTAAAVYDRDDDNWGGPPGPDDPEGDPPPLPSEILDIFKKLVEA